MDVDRLAAGAEAKLDELDRRRASTDVPDEPAADGVDPDGYGFHVDDPETDLLEDDLDAGLRDDGEADALDSLAEAFNARDLDALLDTVAPDGEAPGLLGGDRDNLAEALQDLWQRRSTACLTRGTVGTEHVGVLWEHDGTRWWRLAVVHVDDCQDGRIGVVEFSEDTALLEQVTVEAPDDDFEEGSRWVEWAEGADGDDPPVGA